MWSKHDRSQPVVLLLWWQKCTDSEQSTAPDIWSQISIYLLMQHIHTYCVCGWQVHTCCFSHFCDWGVGGWELGTVWNTEAAFFLKAVGPWFIVELWRTMAGSHREAWCVTPEDGEWFLKKNKTFWVLEHCQEMCSRFEPVNQTVRNKRAVGKCQTFKWRIAVFFFFLFSHPLESHASGRVSPEGSSGESPTTLTSNSGALGPSHSTILKVRAEYITSSSSLVNFVPITSQRGWGNTEPCGFKMVEDIWAYQMGTVALYPLLNNLRV